MNSKPTFATHALSAVCAILCLAFAPVAERQKTETDAAPPKSELPSETSPEMEKLTAFVRERQDAGDLRGMLEGFEKMKALNPNILRVWRFEAYTRSNLHDYAGAKKCIERFVELGGEPDAVHLSILGTYYSEVTKEYAKGIEKLTQAIEKMPTLAFFIQRAMLYQKNGDFAKARSDLDIVLEKIDKNELGDSQISLFGAPNLRSTVLILYAVLLTDEEKYEEAEKYYSEALKYEPTHATLLFSRAQMYAKRGKHKEALADLDLALKDNFDLRAAGYTFSTVGKDNIHEAKGAVYEKMGMLDDALREYLKSYELSVQSDKYNALENVVQRIYAFGYNHPSYRTKIKSENAKYFTSSANDCSIEILKTRIHLRLMNWFDVSSQMPENASGSEDARGETARKELDVLLKRAPKEGDANVVMACRAVIALHEKNHSETLRLCDLLFERGQSTPYLLMYRAAAFYSAGMCEKAMDDFIGVATMEMKDVNFAISQNLNYSLENMILLTKTNTACMKKMRDFLETMFKPEPEKCPEGVLWTRVSLFPPSLLASLHPYLHFAETKDKMNARILRDVDELTKRMPAHVQILKYRLHLLVSLGKQNDETRLAFNELYRCIYETKYLQAMDADKRLEVVLRALISLGNSTEAIKPKSEKERKERIEFCLDVAKMITKTIESDKTLYELFLLRGILNFYANRLGIPVEYKADLEYAKSKMEIKLSDALVALSSIAEIEGNFDLAIEYCKKAQTLFPKADGLIQRIQTLEKMKSEKENSQKKD